MKRILTALAIIAAPAPAVAQTAMPELSLEHRMLVRCSAAFALVARGQETGNAEALRYPDIRESGSEFFVRAGARLMDEAGLDRAQLTTALSQAAQEMQDSDTIGDIMPACLAILDQ